MNSKANVILLGLSCYEASAAVAAARDAVNPLQKVIGMLGDLKEKVVANGAAEDAAYEKYDKFCVKAKRDVGYEIKTGESLVEKQEAGIAKATADIESSSTRAEQLAKDIESNNKDLSAAMKMNEKESSDFKASIGELKGSIDMLGKAINVLSQKLKEKNPTLLQVDQDVKLKEDGFVKALDAIVNAAASSNHEKTSLMAFLDTATKQAPEVAAYTSKSGGIIEVLEEMKEKARGDLSDVGDQLTKAMHEFKMQKGSLSAQIAADEKELGQVKMMLGEAKTSKSSGEADLNGSSKDLKDDKDTLAEYESSCSQAKTDYEASKKSRSEEIEAVEKATQVIKDKTGNAEQKIYNSASFVQISLHRQNQHRGKPDSGAAFEVADKIRAMAKKSQAKDMERLASNIESLVQTNSNDDVFKDIIDLLNNMIEDKKAAAAKDASKKEYCDSEKSKTAQKLDDLNDSNDKMAASVEMHKSEAVTMQAEAEQLASELKALVELQAEMDKNRKEEQAVFSKTKTDMENGLEGVRTALSVLKDYYQGTSESPGVSLLQTKAGQPSFGHSKDTGASEGILGLLEVVEYDFNKDLVAAESAEDTAEEEYQKITDENKVTKIQKNADQKYKSEVSATLSKKLQEKITEKEAISQELASVLDYQKSIEEQCREGGMSYAERVQRREEEIDGLKNALKQIGGTDLTLVQASNLRGAKK